MIKYEDFLVRKRVQSVPVGISNPPELSPMLFPFQRDIVRWALRRGKACLFEECGLGKTWQAIEWSRVVCEHTGLPVLILTPLAVAQQFVREGKKIGVQVNLCREAHDITSGINVTNYDRFERFDPDLFAGIVLDESSILKHHDGKTRTALIKAWGQTPWKLCCTATPAPNDHEELGNHAEFLGVMSRSEMLSMFFCHDGGETQKWRLKGHAERDFWSWVCSWAVALTKPSDLGYSDDGYILPPLHIHEHVVEADHALAQQSGTLFALEARTLNEERGARRASIAERVTIAANLANNSDRPWLCWCDLNSESEALAKAIPDAVEIRGSDDTDEKEKRMLDFIEGRARVLVSKPSIAGHGVNLQHCSDAAYVGLSHSFELWHQSNRRIWRFGQKREVNAHVITSSIEGRVVANIRRKQKDAERIVRGMVEAMSDITREELGAVERHSEVYEPNQRMVIPQWLTA